MIYYKSLMLIFIIYYNYIMDQNTFLNNTNFKFGTNSVQDELLYNPPVRNFKYYQLCSFKIPTTKKYHIRRFIMNSKNEFTNIQESYIDSNKYQQFIRSHPPSDYKLFGTYDLKQIPYPSLGDITIIQSPMLDTNNVNGIHNIISANGCSSYAKF